MQSSADMKHWRCCALVYNRRLFSCWSHASRPKQTQSWCLWDDTEWINNERGQGWTTWLFIFSKISLNFTAMSWQLSVKRKLSATAGPNQFQLALDTRCYRLLYFSLLHQIQLYQHPFQIRSVNTEKIYCSTEASVVYMQRWSVVSASVKRCNDKRPGRKIASAEKH